MRINSAAEVIAIDQLMGKGSIWAVNVTRVTHYSKSRCAALRHCRSQFFE